MAWTAYRLVYRALSQVHVGHRKLGFIERTRHYITGRNIWGAMTANMARTLPVTDELQKHYERVGTEVFNSIFLASYFFPATLEHVPLRPYYGEDGLKYNGVPVCDFERDFVNSWGRTAIVPSSNSAEEGSLHETEFISHIDPGGAPVYFVGYIFVKDNASFDDAKGAVEEIMVGGERKYGFGRLRLEDNVQQVKDNKIFGLDCDLRGENVVLEMKENDALPAHLKTDVNATLSGDIEPLVGRDWGAQGAGQNVTEAVICWTPGSILQEDKDLKIGKHGILEART